MKEIKFLESGNTILCLPWNFSLICLSFTFQNMPRLEPLSGSQKRKLAQNNKEKLQAVLSRTPKLTTLFASRNNIVVDNVDANITLQSIEASNQENQESTNEGQITELTEDSEGDDESNDNNNVHSRCYKSDPALWGKISAEEEDYWLSIGPHSCQNRDASLKPSKRVFNDQERYFSNDQERYFSKSLFTTTLPNGETVSREWLLYSPSTGNVYCFCCKLMSNNRSRSKLATEGFSDWRNRKLLSQHEHSAEHKQAVLDCGKRASSNGTLEYHSKKQLKAQKSYWRSLLQRVVEVLKFLGERRLALSGNDELFGSPHNGNFLGELELLSRFDPFLAEHNTRYGNRGRENPSYLTSTVCDELICLMGNKVLQRIIEEVHKAKYFSFTVDSTLAM